MEARSDSTAPKRTSANGSSIDHAQLRAILSSLSHELCRPLVSLRAGFDLLLGDGARPISPDQRGHVQTMANLCDDMLRLARSYLDYAALVQGARPLHYGAYTVGALVREIDRQFAPLAAARELGWCCALEGDDVTVTTDASRCQQIFGNLVANALKYTPRGGKVWVTAHKDEDRWIVRVVDNGHGIPVESLSKVFEPFVRLARDERSGIEGNGLGLAISQELVEQMGGQIQLESHLGEGTRVEVRLPVSQPVASSKAHALST